MKETSDRTLVAFLQECDPAEIHALMTIMESSLSFTSQELLKKYPSVRRIPRPGTNERRKLAHPLVLLLRWYGSDSIAYMFRAAVGKEEGVHYAEIVRDVARFMNKQRQKKARVNIPKAATVSRFEEIIVTVILEAAVKGKTVKEIAEMFISAGMDRDAAWDSARKFGPGGFVGIALPTLVKILGKKTITVIISGVVTAIVQRFAGKEAAKQVAKRIVATLPQKTIAKFVSVVGWALLAVDAVLFVSSPARRITLPAVGYISALRVRDRLENM